MSYRKLWAVMTALGAVSTLSAQDLIVKTDASKVEARVMEITPEKVSYKRFSNPNGPTYVLPVGDIEYIRYENGDIDQFKQATPASTAVSTPGEPAQTTAPAVTEVATTESAQKPAPAPAVEEKPAAKKEQAPAAEYVIRKYEVGEYYDRNGVKGLVCAVDENGTHGLVLSLKQISLRWSEFKKPDLCIVGAKDRANGENNMEVVEKYVAEKGLSWEMFPAFKWCRELGDGWYIPSIDEWLTIGHNFNGGARIKFDRQARNRFNDAMREHGGDKLDRMMYYFSSTEQNEKSAMTTHMGIEPPYVVDIPKSDRFFVRAVHRF